MTHALAIDSHQEKAHGRARGRPICGGMGHRAPTFNDQPKAVGPRRNFRLGWCFTRRHDFLEIDRLTKAGVEGRVAAQLLTNHSGAQSQFQGISERHVHPSLSTSARSTYASTISRKRFADEQNPCVSGDKID